LAAAPGTTTGTCCGSRPRTSLDPTRPIATTIWSSWKRGLIGDQIDEFERVQKVARRTRELGGEAARLQSHLDFIAEERRLRANRPSELQLHLKRLTRI